MVATEQEMMERTARIQTIEELREACAEFGVEMSPEDEQAFMAAKAELRELSEGELEASPHRKSSGRATSPSAAS